MTPMASEVPIVSAAAGGIGGGAAARRTQCGAVATVADPDAA
jgi:hypothetical protein